MHMEHPQAAKARSDVAEVEKQVNNCLSVILLLRAASANRLTIVAQRTWILPRSTVSDFRPVKQLPRNHGGVAGRRGIAMVEPVMLATLHIRFKPGSLVRC